jgi:hypothetical protein
MIKFKNWLEIINKVKERMCNERMWGGEESRKREKKKVN